jgi:hypothetical protein
MNPAANTTPLPIVGGAVLREVSKTTQAARPLG